MSDEWGGIALIGSAEGTPFREQNARRLRGGEMVVVADSWEEALRKDDRFDAAIAHSYFDALAAVRAGKHVLVDATVVESCEQITSIIQAAQENRTFLDVGVLPRNNPVGQVISRRLSSGNLGVAGLLRVHRWNCPSDRSLAGKIFGDIEQAIDWFDALPNEIYAVGRGGSSYVQIHLGFPGGGMAILDFAESLPQGQHYDSLSLIGSKGAAYADDHHNSHLLFSGNQTAALISDFDDGHLAEMQQFVDKILQRATADNISEKILSSHRVIEAIRKSLESSQVVHERGGVYAAP